MKKFIQQFTTGDWAQPMHQLVVVLDDGTELKSGFTGYAHAAVVEDPKLPGLAGWVSYTDYYDGVMPKVSRFTSVIEEHVSQADIPQAEALPFLNGMAPTAGADLEDTAEAEGEIDEDCANDEEFCFREPTDNRPSSSN